MCVCILGDITEYTQVCLSTGWRKMSHIQPSKSQAVLCSPCLLLPVLPSLQNYFFSFHPPKSFPTRRHYCRYKALPNQAVYCITLQKMNPSSHIPFQSLFYCTSSHLTLLCHHIHGIFPFWRLISSEPKATHLSQTKMLLAGDSITDSFSYFIHISGAVLHVLRGESARHSTFVWIMWSSSLCVCVCVCVCVCPSCAFSTAKICRIYTIMFVDETALALLGFLLLSTICDFIGQFMQD